MISANWLYRFLTGQFLVLHFDKGSSSPPPPPAAPDPAASVTAQARALPSVYSPFGKSVYSGDPNVSGSFRQDVSLAPAEQAKYDTQVQIAQALLGRTHGAIQALPTGNYQFNGATDPTTNKFFSAQKSLLDPVWKVNEDRERQRLANQGIPEGSDAYNEAMRQHAVQRDSAYEQASTNALSTGFNQDLTTRQQQFNEIAQALGGSQLQMPAAGGGSPIDTQGALAAQQAGINRGYQGQMNAYNADVSSQNSLLGAGATVAAAYFF